METLVFMVSKTIIIIIFLKQMFSSVNIKLFFKVNTVFYIVLFHGFEVVNILYQYELIFFINIIKLCEGSIKLSSYYSLTMLYKY